MKISTLELVSKLEKNQYVRAVALIALVLGALITIGTFSLNTSKFLYDNVFVANNISNRIKKLAAGQDIEYFKKYLGAQILQKDVNSNLAEYVFNYKESYIQTLVEKKNDEVIYWAVTYCGNTPVILERPVFSMGGRYLGKDMFGQEVIENFLSPRLLLNRSTFTDFLKKEEGDLKVFISGATANSFAYESLYFGNPGAYQTIIVGVNDICPSAGDLYDHLDVDDMYLDDGEKPTEEAVNSFRKSVRINTYGETAPFRGEEVVELLNAIHSEDFKDPYINFGVDRIRVRYFPKN